MNGRLGWKHCGICTVSTLPPHLAQALKKYLLILLLLFLYHYKGCLFHSFGKIHSSNCNLKRKLYQSHVLHLYMALQTCANLHHLFLFCSQPYTFRKVLILSTLHICGHNVHLFSILTSSFTLFTFKVFCYTFYILKLKPIFLFYIWVFFFVNFF